MNNKGADSGHRSWFLALDPLAFPLLGQLNLMLNKECTGLKGMVAESVIHASAEGRKEKREQSNPRL